MPRSYLASPLARILILLGAAVIPACSGNVDTTAGREAVRRGEAPLHVLLITLDTARADRFRCYGRKDAETPNVDRLADRGVLFENAIASVPLTVPSHASILTGAFPTHHGVRTNDGKLMDDPNLTLAEILREHGYATGAFLGAAVLQRHCGLDQGFDLYWDDFSGTASAGGLAYPEKRADVVVRAASDWIGRQGGKPFFAWVHLFDPHLPYDPPPPFRNAWSASPYDGEIAYADECIGKLLESLERAGVRNDTLVAFLSDHGEGLGDHGENTHGVFVYDTTVHVPLVLCGPRLLPAGRRIANQVRVIDIVPTILDFLGVDAPEGIQGRSLLPLVDGAVDAPRDAYVESYYPNRSFGWSPLLALRTDTRKAIQAPRPELYDLERDPGEARNRFDASPDEATGLLARLEAWIPEISREGVAESASLDARTRAMLRELGYVTGSAAPAEEGRERELPDPKDKREVLARLQTASTLVYEGNTEAALRLLDGLLREEPDSPQVLTLAGEALLRVKNYAAARDVYLKLLERDPRSEDALVNLGSLYLVRNEPKLALPYFERALEVNPSSADALFSLGNLYYRTFPDPTKARHFFERFLEVAPSDPQAASVRNLLRSL